MQFIRIGDKIISRQQIDKWVDDILSLRSNGLSQQEVAQQLKIDRSFISRLESLGELRKGRRLAVIGFPVANGKELESICQRHGVDWWLFFSEQERLGFVSNKTGLELFNEFVDILATIRSYDTVVVIGSNKRVQIIEALLDREVIRMVLGESPLREDVWVNTDEFTAIIKSLCAEEEGK